MGPDNNTLITDEVAAAIDASVLCWLATVSAEGAPNVSPKEAFLHGGQGRILVANIASPVTVRNIRAVPQVCASFVDVFVQRGFKVEGGARVIGRDDPGYGGRHALLTAEIGDAFEILSIIEIEPQSVSEIVAPSYRLFPEPGEIDRIREALATYRVDEYRRRAELEGDERPARTA